MTGMENALRQMDFDFFGRALHKTSAKAFLDEPDAVLLDLRSRQERDVLPVSLHWLTTLHIPLHELPDRLDEIPKDRPVGAFCSSDSRSAIAMAYLRACGYDQVRIVAGGYQGLVQELMPGKVFHRHLSEG